MAIPAAAANRTCLVTGASSGIGVEIARQLAGRGRGVTLVARREAPMRELAAELADRHGIRAEVIAADLTDSASRSNIASAVEDRGLTVDVLVNNAGISTFGAIGESTPEAELALVETNVAAVVHLCSIFAPKMAERRGGAILNVASTAAFQPLPGQAAYGASKSFVLSYSHSIRAELKSSGVGVTVLCPGPVDTGFGEAAGFDPGDAADTLPKFMWVEPTEVARAAVDGTFKGRDVVIPGAANQLLAGFGYLLPRKLLVPILARQHPALK